LLTVVLVLLYSIAVADSCTGVAVAANRCRNNPAK
jgi:hypothetical protein